MELMRILKSVFTVFMNRQLDQCPDNAASYYSVVEQYIAVSIIFRILVKCAVCIITATTGCRVHYGSLNLYSYAAICFCSATTRILEVRP